MNSNLLGFYSTHTKDVHKGTSFRNAGRWTKGIRYLNDRYIIDFVVYVDKDTQQSVMLSCKTSHIATSETEPNLFFVYRRDEVDPSKKLEVVGVKNIPDCPWDFVMASLRGFEGKTAYEVAVDNGFIGTEQEWLDSLIATVTEESITNALGYVPAHITVHSTSEWNALPEYVPDNGEMIVYSDYDKTTINGIEVNVPGIKIGTGNTSVHDLTFITDEIYNRISIIDEVTSSALNDLENRKYEKPISGIPGTDLESAVQTSLGKADTAVQPSDVDDCVRVSEQTFTNAQKTQARENIGILFVDNTEPEEPDPPLIIPLISTNIETDKDSVTRTVCPKAVYDYVNDAISDNYVLLTESEYEELVDGGEVDLNKIYMTYEDDE